MNVCSWLDFFHNSNSWHYLILIWSLTNHSVMWLNVFSFLNLESICTSQRNSMNILIFVWSAINSSSYPQFTLVPYLDRFAYIIIMCWMRQHNTCLTKNLNIWELLFRQGGGGWPVVPFEIHMQFLATLFLLILREVVQ